LTCPCRVKPPPTPKRPIPKELEQLAALQTKNGQWKPSAEVYHCLGDYVPAPPDGVAEVRWLTTLCVAFIKWVRTLHNTPRAAPRAARACSCSQPVPHPRDAVCMSVAASTSRLRSTVAHPVTRHHNQFPPPLLSPLPPPPTSIPIPLPLSRAVGPRSPGATQSSGLRWRQWWSRPCCGSQTSPCWTRPWLRSHPPSTSGWTLTSSATGSGSPRYVWLGVGERERGGRGGAKMLLYTAEGCWGPCGGHEAALLPHHDPPPPPPPSPMGAPSSTHALTLSWSA
jgi:hypothetical protein